MAWGHTLTKLCLLFGLLGVLHKVRFDKKMLSIKNQPKLRLGKIKVLKTCKHNEQVNKHMQIIWKGLKWRWTTKIPELASGHLLDQYRNVELQAEVFAENKGWFGVFGKYRTLWQCLVSDGLLSGESYGGLKVLAWRIYWGIVDLSSPKTQVVLCVRLTVGERQMADTGFLFLGGSLG